MMASKIWGAHQDLRCACDRLFAMTICPYTTFPHMRHASSHDAWPRRSEVNIKIWGARVTDSAPWRNTYTTPPYMRHALSHDAWPRRSITHGLEDLRCACDRLCISTHLVRASVGLGTHVVTSVYFPTYTDHRRRDVWLLSHVHRPHVHTLGHLAFFLYTQTTDPRNTRLDIWLLPYVHRPHVHTLGHLAFFLYTQTTDPIHTL